jgi:hypothetical protein
LDHGVERLDVRGDVGRELRPEPRYQRRHVHVPRTPSSGTWLTARRYEDDVLMLGSLPAPVSITFRISVGLDPTIAAPSITS